MSTLVLRLAAPVQSWGGYRRNVAHVATHSVPTRSGMAGLLGACLGQADYRSLLPKFSLRVRVDRTNPVMRDLQVAVGPTTHRELEAADRAVKFASTSGWGKAAWPKGGIIDSSAGGGLYQRHFLPHAEFMCELIGADSDVRDWLQAVRRPVFMPYLGRQSNAPTWPFLLGIHDDQNDLFDDLPRVATGVEGQLRRIPVHDVDGDYLQHTTTITWATPPVVPTRKELMTWASNHLSR